MLPMFSLSFFLSVNPTCPLLYNDEYPQVENIFKIGSWCRNKLSGIESDTSPKKFLIHPIPPNKVPWNPTCWSSHVAFVKVYPLAHTFETPNLD